MSIEELVTSIETALQTGAGVTVPDMMVRLGAAIRAEPPSSARTAILLRRIHDSTDQKLIGLLTYVLAGYDSVPEGLLASLLRSRTLPGTSLPALAVAGTFGQVPKDWSAGKQVALWIQVFMTYPDFLPGLREAYLQEHPPTGTAESFGMSFDLSIRFVEARKITDAATVDAIFARVLGDEQDAGAILVGLFSLVALDNEHVVESAMTALSHTSNIQVRRQLVSWIAQAPTNIASQELFKVFCAASSPEEKLQAGTELIARVPGSESVEFRILWPQTDDETVRVGLVHALGRNRTNESLIELERAYGSNSELVKEAVREEVEGHLRVCDCESGRKLHQEVGPSAHPWLPPR